MPNGYIKSKNGNPVEIVDAFARNKLPFFIDFHSSSPYDALSSDTIIVDTPISDIVEAHNNGKTIVGRFNPNLSKWKKEFFYCEYIQMSSNNNNLTSMRLFNFDSLDNLKSITYTNTYGWSARSISLNSFTHRYTYRDSTEKIIDNMPFNGVVQYNTNGIYMDYYYTTELIDGDEYTYRFISIDGADIHYLDFITDDWETFTVEHSSIPLGGGSSQYIIEVYTNGISTTSTNLYDVTGMNRTYDEIKSAFDSGEHLVVKLFTNAEKTSYTFVNFSESTAGTAFKFSSMYGFPTLLDAKPLLVSNEYVQITSSSITAVAPTGGIIPYTTNVLMKDNTTAFTPTSNYHPATKKYVDDIVGDIETALDAILGGNA